MPGHVLVEGRAGSRTGLAHQPAFAGDQCRRDRRHAGQRMIRMGGNDKPVFQERACLDRKMGRHLPHDDEVVLVVGEPFDHAGAVGHDQPRHHRLMPGDERAQQVRNEILGGGHHGQAQRPLHGVAQRVERFLQRLQPGEDIGAGGMHLVPRRREEETPPDMLEQLGAGVLLQPPELDRNRLLREVKLLGGAGEMAMACHRLEQSELLQRQVHGRSISFCLSLQLKLLISANARAFLPCACLAGIGPVGWGSGGQCHAQDLSGGCAGIPRDLLGSALHAEGQ
ncbi:protein of unknown function [Rhodovastum atsumiense]|nr:protein of unknown function [Rhodovastum atsumiense]